MDRTHKKLDAIRFVPDQGYTSSRRLCVQLRRSVIGEQDEGNGWQNLFELPRRLKPVHDRHREVEHDQVGPQLLRFLDCLHSVFGFPAYHVSGLFEQSSKGMPDQRAVIDDKYAVHIRQISGKPSRVSLVRVCAPARRFHHQVKAVRYRTYGIPEDRIGLRRLIPAAFRNSRASGTVPR